MDSTSKAEMESYFACKNVRERNARLTRLVLECPDGAGEFFAEVFRKERLLPMKLAALRGFAHDADEQEVTVLAEHLLSLVRNYPTHTPYAYQPYEVMRSAFLLPYLVKTYGYPCFTALQKQVEQQYQALPDCFKGIFTCNERGAHISLKDPQIASKEIRVFLDTQGVKTES